MLKCRFYDFGRTPVIIFNTFLWSFILRDTINGCVPQCVMQSCKLLLQLHACQLGPDTANFTKFAKAIHEI